MVKKRQLLLGWIAAIALFSGCESVNNSDRWQRGKRYVWIPPRTGSLVGRWVAKDDGGGNARPDVAEKKKRDAKRALAKKKAKKAAAEPEPARASSPPERFR